jgi:glycerol kinase
MQFQADISGIDVVRPTITETTALGAAYAAGLATGFWSGTDELSAQWQQDQIWHPAMPEATRANHLAAWTKAIARSLNWT